MSFFYFYFFYLEERSKKKVQLKNGQRTEQIICHRGNADGQQAHEKMLSIANHQGNVNQHHNEISSHTHQEGRHEKEHK